MPLLSTFTLVDRVMIPFSFIEDVQNPVLLRVSPIHLSGFSGGIDFAEMLDSSYIYTFMEEGI